MPRSAAFHTRLRVYYCILTLFFVQEEEIDKEKEKELQKQFLVSEDDVEFEDGTISTGDFLEKEFPVPSEEEFLEIQKKLESNYQKSQQETEKRERVSKKQKLSENVDENENEEKKN
jgi:hypothetical protein